MNNPGREFVFVVVLAGIGLVGVLSANYGAYKWNQGLDQNDPAAVALGQKLFLGGVTITFLATGILAAPYVLPEGASLLASTGILGLEGAGWGALHGGTLAYAFGANPSEIAEAAAWGALEGAAWGLGAGFVGAATSRLLARNTTSLSRGAELRLRYGSTFSEYRRFRSQGYTPMQAKYLTQPYSKTGQHFFYQRFLDRVVRRMGESTLRGRVLTWFKDSPLNLIKGRNMSIGRFYEYHARLHQTPKFGINSAAQSWAFPKSVGGGRWNYRNVVDRPAPWGQVGYVWHGSPTGFKITTGGIIIGSSWGIYELVD